MPFKNYVFAALGLSIATVFAVFVFWKNLPPEVPLFYGRPAGSEQLTSTAGLIIAPATATGILMTNLFISTLLKDTFLKKILIVTSLVTSILTAITVIKVILVVGFF